MSEDLDLLLELLDEVEAPAVQAPVVKAPVLPVAAQPAVAPPVIAVTPPARTAPVRSSAPVAPLPAPAVRPRAAAVPAPRTQVGSLTARTHVLRVPFEERFLARSHGIQRDEARGVNILTVHELPAALVHIASQPYSWERWVEDDLNAGAEVSPHAIPVQRSEKITLRPHQEEALRVVRKAMMAKRHGFLIADEVGLGKTFEAIGAAMARKPKRVLILTPLSAVEQWRLSIAALDRDDEVRWLVINYDRAKSLLEAPKAAASAKKTRTKNKHTAASGRSKVAWDIVICDEAHMLSNPVAQRTSAVRRLSGEGQPYRAFSMWLSATAGQTPLALSYLAPILREDGAAVFDLEEFASFMRAKGIQVERGSYGAWTWNPTDDKRRAQDLETMRALLYDGAIPRGIRRRPTDIAGWPERQRVVLPIELEPAEMRAYEMEWDHFRSQMHLGRRQKSSNNPRVRQMRYRQKAELLKLRGIAEETRTQLANGFQVVVGLEFLESISQFVEAMGREPVAVVTGEVTGPAREAEKVRFQRGEALVVATNITAAINLHAGDKMVGGNDTPRTTICSPRWSGVSLHQLEGRSHRDGQYSLNRIAIVSNSVETTIAKVMLRRLKDIQGINGDEDDSEETAALIEDALAEIA